MTATTLSARDALHKIIDATADDSVLDQLARVILMRAAFQELAPDVHASMMILAAAVGNDRLDMDTLALCRVPGQPNAFIIGTVKAKKREGATWGDDRHFRVVMKDPPFDQWLPASELTFLR